MARLLSTLLMLMWLLPVGPAEAGYCESPLVLVDDNYSGGNMGVCQFTDEARLELTITPEDSPPINQSAWYSFRLSPRQPGELVISLHFVDGYPRYWPKLGENGENWYRADANRVVIDNARSELRLKLELAAAPLYVSAQELLVNADYEHWMHGMAQHAELSQRNLGASMDGRPVQALLTEEKAEVIYLFGRQHPPEITGGLAMLDFVESLFADTALARDFRQRFMLVIVPLINPDGVDAGHWRHNRGGRDLNRDWGPFTQPETRSIKRLLDQLDGKGIAPALMLDFHSTRSSVFYTQMPDDFDGDADFARVWLEQVRARLPDYDFAYDPRPPSGQDNAKNYFFARYRIPAITYEIGDAVDREQLEAATPVFAEEMMRVMLEQ